MTHDAESPARSDAPAAPDAHDGTREGHKVVFSYGPGRIPPAIVLLWIGFVAFFLWYTLSFQLPQFKASFRGPSEAAGPESATEAPAAQEDDG